MEKSIKIRATRKQTEDTLEYQIPISKEIEEKFDIRITPKKNNYGIFKNFITINQDVLIDLITNFDLNKQELKLFIYLLGKANYGNDITGITTYLDLICQDLNIDKGNISRSLKSLNDKNILILHKRLAGSNKMPIQIEFTFDKINSNIGYKGKLEDLKRKDIRALDKPLNTPQHLLKLEKENEKHEGWLKQVDMFDNSKVMLVNPATGEIKEM